MPCLTPWKYILNIGRRVSSSSNSAAQTRERLLSVESIRRPSREVILSLIVIGRECPIIVLLKQRVSVGVSGPRSHSYLLLLFCTGC